MHVEAATQWNLPSIPDERHFPITLICFMICITTSKLLLWAHYGMWFSTGVHWRPRTVQIPQVILQYRLTHETVLHSNSRIRQVHDATVRHERVRTSGIFADSVKGDGLCSFIGNSTKLQRCCQIYMSDGSSHKLNCMHNLTQSLAPLSVGVAPAQHHWTSTIQLSNAQ